MNNILNLQTKKYELQLDNFEGPLDLLCYLIEKNKMDIYQVKIADIADQYVEYLKEQEKLNLDIASEFLLMASTLVLIKSRGLLPKTVEDEAELTEEELIKRIIEYKQYKEISRYLKENMGVYSKRLYKTSEPIELPKQKLEIDFSKENIIDAYKALIQRNEEKKNENAKNIEKIAIHETYTVSDKVKEIFNEFSKRPKFVFGKLFKINEKPKEEIVTAFSGVLELNKRNKINADQKEIFGDIVISKVKNVKLDDFFE